MFIALWDGYLCTWSSECGDCYLIITHLAWVWILKMFILIWWAWCQVVSSVNFITTDNVALRLVCWDTSPYIFLVSGCELSQINDAQIFLEWFVKLGGWFCMVLRSQSVLKLGKLVSGYLPIRLCWDRPLKSQWAMWCSSNIHPFNKSYLGLTPMGIRCFHPLMAFIARYVQLQVWWKVNYCLSAWHMAIYLFWHVCFFPLTDACIWCWISHEFMFCQRRHHVYFFSSAAVICCRTRKWVRALFDSPLPAILNVSELLRSHGATNGREKPKSCTTSIYAEDYPQQS